MKFISMGIYRLSRTI